MTTPAERTEAMTEPTQAQIDEAHKFAIYYGVDHGDYYAFQRGDIADLIAHIRREARNAALEEAAERAFDYITLWAPLQHSKDFADSIRALKDQP